MPIVMTGFYDKLDRKSDGSTNVNSARALLEQLIEKYESLENLYEEEVWTLKDRILDDLRDLLSKI